MKSITGVDPHSTLSRILPGHQFGEHHAGVVAAPPEAVWRALHELRWGDLRVARPLMGLRHLGMPVVGETVWETFTTRAGAASEEEAPRRATLVMVGKPWSAVPQHADVHTLEEVAAFAEPGWLKYGMDWVLTPLEGDRTLVETTTLCEATDATARRAFTVYWGVIRAGSALIRVELIDTLRRLTRR